MQLLTDKPYSACGDQSDAKRQSHFLTVRRQLLDRYCDRKRSDPGEVHDPADEQQRHQCPTATQAEPAMPQSHHKGAADARAPFAEQKTYRRPAIRETDALQR